MLEKEEENEATPRKDMETVTAVVAAATGRYMGTPEGNVGCSTTEIPFETELQPRHQTSLTACSLGTHVRPSATFYAQIHCEFQVILCACVHAIESQYKRFPEKTNKHENAHKTF